MSGISCWSEQDGILWSLVRRRALVNNQHLPLSLFFTAKGATAVVGCAFGSEEQTNAKVLVIDVYSAKVPSDALQEMAIAYWGLHKGRRSMGFQGIFYANYLQLTVLSWKTQEPCLT